MRATVLLALLLPAVLWAGAPAQDSSGEPFLEWLLGPSQALLAPRQRPPLQQASREALLKAALPVLRRLIENGPPELRGEALMTLAAIQPDRSLPEVLARLEPEESDLRQSAIMAAGLTGHSGALPVLDRLLAQAEGEQGLGRLAAVAIGLLGPGLGSSTLQGRFRHALDLSQKSLVQELLAMLAGLNLCGRKGDAAALVFVLEQSKVQEPQVHELTLHVAARLDPLATRRQVEQTLRREREIQAATLATLAFPSEKDKESVPYLTHAVTRPGLDSEIRIQALLALGRRREPAALQALQRLAPRIPAALAPFLTLARGLAGDKDKRFHQGCLDDLRKATDPARRAAAALALGCPGLPGEGPKLRHAFEAEKDPRVQGAIALSLGMLGENAVSELLGRVFLESGSSFLRRSAALALTVLAPGRPLPGEALEPSRVRARAGFWAQRLRWLGLFGGADVAQLYLGLVTDPETPPSLLTESLRGLRVLADPRREPALLALLFHDPLPMPVQALTEARQLAWGPGATD